MTTPDCVSASRTRCECTSPPSRSRLCLHPLRVHQQLVDHARKAREGEVERNRGVRSDHALHRRMRNIAFVPQRNVLPSRAWHRTRTMRASPVRFSVNTGLRLCGLAEEPFWPGAKVFLRFQNFGPLQVADFCRDPLDRRGDNTECCKKHGVADHAE